MTGQWLRRRRTVVAFWVLVATVGGVLLWELSLSPQIRTDGPLVIYRYAWSSRTTDMDDLSQFRGSLQLDHHCLTLDGRPVVFPPGTAWDALHQAVITPEGGRAALGDVVSGVGRLRGGLHDVVWWDTDLGRELSPCRHGVSGVSVLEPLDRVRVAHP